MARNKQRIDFQSRRDVNIIHMIHEVEDQSKERKKAIKDQWQRIIAWNEHLPSDLKNYRIYRDGLLPDISKDAMLKEVKKYRKEMSMENVIWQKVLK